MLLFEFLLIRFFSHNSQVFLSFSIHPRTSSKLKLEQKLGPRKTYRTKKLKTRIKEFNDNVMERFGKIWKNRKDK